MLKGVARTGSVGGGGGGLGGGGGIEQVDPVCWYPALQAHPQLEGFPAVPDDVHAALAGKRDVCQRAYVGFAIVQLFGAVGHAVLTRRTALLPVSAI